MRTGAVSPEHIDVRRAPYDNRGALFIHRKKKTTEGR